MTSPTDISDVMRQEGSDQEQDAWRLKKYPSLYGDELVTPRDKTVKVVLHRLLESRKETE